MNLHEPKFAPGVIAQVRALAAGRATVGQIVEALLARVSEAEYRVCAWAHLDVDRLQRAAADLDKQRADGKLKPLHGLVFAAKDNFDSFDMPTAYGSKIHADFRPARDASTVATLRGQGALLMGKTVTTEFAHVTPGATRNPSKLEHTPGGSSSGSAAAVASGMVPLAFGSQTTGSVIRPAAYCGVVGFKPTYGVLNVSGMLANCPSFDTVGFMTRSIDDVMFVFSRLLDITDISAAALNGTLPRVTLSELRVGVCNAPTLQSADADQNALVERAAAAVANAGARVEAFNDLGAFDDLAANNRIVAGFEFARTLADERHRASQHLSLALKNGRLRDGLEHDYDDYIRATAAIDAARTRLDKAFERVDIVLSPPAPGAAPRGLQSTGDATFNMPWTTLHTPAVTLPMAKTDDGLPLGLQVTARRHADLALLRQAHAIEACIKRL